MPYSHHYCVTNVMKELQSTNVMKELQSTLSSQEVKAETALHLTAC